MFRPILPIGLKIIFLFFVIGVSMSSGNPETNFYKKKMHRKIFAVGDSHSRRCFEDHKQIADSRVLIGHNKLDGKTAYNLMRHEKKLLRILTPLRDKEIIFCFGEVDVRLHIKYKHQQLGTPVTQLIDKTAERYISYVRELRKTG